MSAGLNTVAAHDPRRGLSRLSATWPLLLPALAIVGALLLLPLVQMILVSFHEQRFGRVLDAWTFGNYAEIFTQTRYVEIYVKTFLTAGAVTALCAVLGYPIAMQIARAPARRRGLLFLLVAAPLLINTVVRSYAWLLVLGNAGLVNQLLLDAGLRETPLRLTGNFLGLIISATQVFLPFMILSLAAALQRIDRRLFDASAILGASAWRRFWTVTFPLSRPGLVAGSILVFGLMLGAFVTPLIIGGSTLDYLSVTIYTDALVLFNLPRATALSMVLMVIALVLFSAQSALTRQREMLR